VHLQVHKGMPPCTPYAAHEVGIEHLRVAEQAERLERLRGRGGTFGSFEAGCALARVLAEHAHVGDQASKIILSERHAEEEEVAHTLGSGLPARELHARDERRARAARPRAVCGSSRDGCHVSRLVERMLRQLGVAVHRLSIGREGGHLSSGLSEREKHICQSGGFTLKCVAAEHAHAVHALSGNVLERLERLAREPPHIALPYLVLVVGAVVQEVEVSGQACGHNRERRTGAARVRGGGGQADEQGTRGAQVDDG
jgi:hypothetical protein